MLYQMSYKAGVLCQKLLCISVQMYTVVKKLFFLNYAVINIALSKEPGENKFLL